MKNSKLSIAIVCALGMVFSFQEITAQTPTTTQQQTQTRQSTSQQDLDRQQEQRRNRAQETPQQRQNREQRQQDGNRETTQAQDRIQQQRGQEQGNQSQMTPQQRQENRDRYNQRMFTHLNMTGDQIRQFNERERELQRSQRGSEMNREQLQNRRNENMRGILNSDQYSNYEAWSRSNPQDF